MCQGNKIWFIHDIDFNNDKDYLVVIGSINPKSSDSDDRMNLYFNNKILDKTFPFWYAMKFAKWLSRTKIKRGISIDGNYLVCRNSKVRLNQYTTKAFDIVKYIECSLYPEKSN